MRMVHCLACLGHHSVISSHNDNDNICDLGTAGTHGGKCFMTGGVKECNDLFTLKSDGIGSDMLCYAPSLTGYHVGVADIVKELGLAMVNVSHHSDNRGPRPELAFIIFLLLHCLL